MWRRIGFGFLWAVPAYFVGAIGGGYLVYALSANRHDLEIEAVMTGAFAIGPLLACIGFVIGAMRGGRRPPSRAS
jgi:hypothetical protein